MSKSVSETGHAKNVANLGVMNSSIAVLDTKYDPSNPLIAADALVAKKLTCEAAMKAVNSGSVIYKKAVISRNDAYNGMSKLSTRVCNSFGSCGATEAAQKSMVSLKDKVEGKRIKPLPTPPVPKAGDPIPDPLKTNSVSQMSFDSRKSNLEKQIAFVAAEPLYKPKEADLTVVALNLYVNSLEPLNVGVNDSLKQLQKDVQSRNVELYAPITGLVSLSKTVKKYAKSIDGANNPASKVIVNIKFTNHKLK